MNSTRPASHFAALTLAAMGVVYGDIGTSPLYALKEVFVHVPWSHDALMGVLSLMFWTLMVVVSLKYVVLILRADNNGEGGLIAMLALASHAVADRPRLRSRLLVLGVFGTAIFFGDGIITPAISVLSAVEGLGVAAPQLERFIVPLTVGVLTLLFFVQKQGTGLVGKWFGPITVLWFVVLAILGLIHIAQHPAVLHALNPVYAVSFAMERPMVTFVALGSVVLCVTGAEALYADMGHFGKKPIRFAWFALVMPALVLNYFGQGALLLLDPSNLSNPFYKMAPTWGLYPLIGLATCATVIASQALITATFSVSKQAIQLGYLPRMRIEHTSVKEAGQIYVPFMNWALYVLIVVAVVAFGSSSKLASAYGIAVTTDMLITTIMTFFVVRYLWKMHWAVCVIATGLFFLVDLAFFAANLAKLSEPAAWFPIVIGVVMFTLMMTWHEGRALMRKQLRSDAVELRTFLDAVFVSPPTRVEGTAVFLVSDLCITPNALLHNLKHNKVLHQVNLFVNVQHHERPWVGFDKRCEVQSLGHDCWQVTLHFGFKNDPDVPEALKLLQGRGIQIDPMETSFFLSREIVIPTIGEGMMMWREKLFANMHRNASDAADFLRLPANRVVELGSKIEI